MSRLEERYEKDRALRDAARAVLLDDVDHARTNLTPNAIAGRVTSRIGNGAKDVLDVAKDKAGEHRTLIAAIIAAVVLWLGREPIRDLFDSLFDQEHDAPDAPDARDANAETGDSTAPSTAPSTDVDTASAAITQSEDNDSIGLHASPNVHSAPSGDHDEH